MTQFRFLSRPAGGPASLAERLGFYSIAGKINGLILFAIVCQLCNAAYQLKVFQDQLWEQRRHELTSLSAAALSIAVSEHQGAQAGTVSAGEAQERAKARIGALRYGNGDYFWINDFGPRMVMHPVRPELNGTDLSNSKDPSGLRLFMEFVKVVRKDGNGFVAYGWPRPGEAQPSPKLSHVVGFAPWGWIIGTGVYVDDLEAKFWAEVQSQTVVILAIVLFCVAVSVMIGRGLSRSIGAMCHSMQQLAGGNLDIEIAGTERRDEIGQMARALGHFQTQAREKIEVERRAEAERVRAEAEAAAHEHARLEAAKRAQAEQREAEAAAIRIERQTVAVSFGTALKNLASKDLTYRLAGDVPEAYVQLQADFNAAVSQVEEALHEVQQSAEAITVGAGQISVASDDLSQRTEQQAAKLENSSVVLMDIARQIEATAADAGAANKVVASARALAEASNKVVQSTTDAMTGIADSSSKISAIVGIIDAIAFQTNMLALNAAVEAARAGDVGKGFAVVATEVRALAQRSAGAASEIKSLIQTSAGQVDAGVRMVDETSRVLGHILREVSEASVAVERIVTANHEQAAKVKSVSAAVSELDTMTQQNAAMAEEATGASQSLRGETERLNHLIQAFEVGLKPADARAVRSRPVAQATRRGAISQPGKPQRRLA